MPLDRLDAMQKAYVIKAQQAAVAASAKQAEAARGWKRLENGIEVATLGNMEEAPKGEFEVASESSCNGKLLLSYREPDDGDDQARMWSVSTSRRNLAIQNANRGLRIGPTFHPGRAICLGRLLERASHVVDINRQSKNGERSNTAIYRRHWVSAIWLRLFLAKWQVPCYWRRQQKDGRREENTATSGVPSQERYISASGRSCV